MGRTSIQVSEALADELHARKDRGDSYEDVIWGLMEDDGGSPAGEDGSTVDDREDVAEPHEGVVLPDGVPNHVDRAATREAIAAAVELVEADGGVQRSAIADSIGETHSLGYDNFGRKGAWWRKIIKPGLEANGCGYTNGVGWAR